MKRKKLISWIAVILWMVMIFSLSAQSAASSNQLSKGITGIIVEMIENLMDIDVEISEINHFVRKNAHFFAYLILGVLVTNALRFHTSGFKLIILAGLICAGYAISDEIHQMFVPGRGPQLKDVIIDSGGALAGIASYKMTFNKWVAMRSRRRIIELSWTDSISDD
jgi:VanZ family protein